MEPTTNNDRLFECFVNSKHKLLDVDLKPLSLLHLLWLYQINSPAVNTSLPITLKDLQLVALICSSTTSEEILEKINLQPFHKKVKLWLWSRRNRKKDLKAEVQKFITYNDDYLLLPEFEPINSKEHNEKIPWMLTHASNVIRATGWSDSEVFTMPIGKLLWYSLSFSYLESGKTNILSDKEAYIQQVLLKEKQQK